MSTNLVTGRERVASVLFYGVMGLLAYLVFRIFQPFLVPLGWAVVFVVVFYPWHRWLERRWGRSASAAVSTVAVTVILIVPALLLMTAFVHEGVEALRNIQQAVEQGRLPWVQKTWQWMQDRVAPQVAVDPDTLVRDAAGFLAARLSAVLRNVAVFLFDLVVTLLAMFYLFRDAGPLVAGLRRVLPFEEKQREQILRQAHELIQASVTVSLIVAAVQGALGGVVFALLGIGSPVFWGVVMAFLSLLPLVGAWIVWLPAAVWLIANGELGKGLLLVALGAGVVGTADNVLRPLLISGRARLSGLVVFVSVLGGIAVFGMLGLVLGPIVVATAAGLLEAYTRQQEPAAAPVGHNRSTVLE
ncbi:MAG: AI-2E family transporter [Firmicutes bacterium]|nr:AI-2E family transporter [Bacillota bacterium]